MTEYLYCDDCGAKTEPERAVGWLCVDDVLDIWVCPACAGQYTGERGSDGRK